MYIEGIVFLKLTSISKKTQFLRKHVEITCICGDISMMKEKRGFIIMGMSDQM